MLIFRLYLLIDRWLTLTLATYEMMKNEVVNVCLSGYGLGVWYLVPLSTIFQIYRGGYIFQLYHVCYNITDMNIVHSGLVQLCISSV